MNTFCTPEENYRLFGKLPDCQLVEVIDRASKAKSFSDSVVVLNDALCPVVEDFLCVPIKHLQNVINAQRKGALKEALSYILAELDDVQMTVYRAVEYSDDIVQSVIENENRCL